MNMKPQTVVVKPIMSFLFEPGLVAGLDGARDERGEVSRARGGGVGGVIGWMGEGWCMGGGG
jgi:hypothetical protein